MSPKLLVVFPLAAVIYCSSGNTAQANPLLICGAKVAIRFVGSYLLPKLMDRYVFNAPTPEIQKVRSELAWEIRKIEKSNEGLHQDVLDKMREGFAHYTSWLEQVERDGRATKERLATLQKDFVTFRRETAIRLDMLEGKIRELELRVDALEARVAAVEETQAKDRADIEELQMNLKIGTLAKDPEFYLKRYRKFLAEGDFHKALANLNVAAELSVVGQKERASYFIAKDQPDLAIMQCSIGIERVRTFPKSGMDSKIEAALAQMFVDRGSAYTRKNRFDLAVADFTRAMDQIKDSTKRDEVRTHKDQAMAACIRAVQGSDGPARTLAIISLYNLERHHKDLEKLVPLNASAKGKYFNMLDRVHRPNDRATYSDYSDRGWMTVDGASAYWVYSYPYLYAWTDLSKN